MRLDPHTHTIYSGHSYLTLARYINIAKKKKLDAVAVTDHNAVAGALALKKQAPFKVIVGEEINTRDGEIIGLFLKKKILPSLSALSTVNQIHRQGGLVYVCHPFDRYRHKAINRKILNKIIKQVDILEVFNSRTIFKKDDQTAKEFAKRHYLLPIAGSDSHSSCELGNAGIEIANFSGTEDFLAKLKTATLFGHYSSILVHVATKWIKWRKHLA